MVAEMPLSGMKVLITRPTQQAGALAELITQQGGEPVCFPVIEINGIDKKLWTGDSLHDADIIIFVSRNAVEYLFDGIDEDLPSSSLVIAVGKATAAALHQHDMDTVLQPTQAVGSEGVLMLPELAQVEGKKIVIVRGRGGRELLADTLATRGAKISYIEVYERNLPSPTDEQYAEALTAKVLVCTSVVGVTNLSSLLKKNIKTILTKPLIVLSERIKQQALSLGFTDVVISADTNDQAIVQRLLEMER